MIKRAVLLLSLMTLSTMALAQTSVSSPGLNCVQPQAVGDGAADDTVALQNAFNAAAAGNYVRAVCLQPGRYKYSSDLILPSKVSVYGLTGSFNLGVELDPMNGARLVIDGVGDWHVRSTISNLTLKLSGSQASAIYINQAYHLTFDRVAIYSAHYATTAALIIANITTFVCNYCVVWGKQSAPDGTGILVNGFDAQIQMNSPNIEGMNIGMSVSGGTQLTMVEPWFEKNITGYVHNTTFGAGSARIFGGTFSLPPGPAIGIDVQGDHLLVQGTLFEHLASAAYGLALSEPIYTDVKLLGIPSIAEPNTFKTGANLMGVQVDPPQAVRLFPGRIHFVKQVPSGTATGILKLSSFTQFGRFRLTLTAFGGNGFQTKQYDFGVTANTIVGNTDPIVTPLSTYSNSNWQLALGSLRFTVSGSDLTVSITATQSGALGQGQNPTIVGELEVLNYEPAAARGAIYTL